MIKIIKLLLLLLPHGLYLAVKPYSVRGVLRYIKYKKVLAKNIAFKNSASSDRCFILCNGPSVKKQNLLSLKNEVVISVSSGYLHDQFLEINPQFHCVPQITYGLLTEQDVVSWFMEMDAHLGNATLFLSDTEYDLVQKYNLFRTRKVHYLNLSRQFTGNEHQIFDLTTTLPMPISVSIMCLMVGIYMGYKKIYLLGTEHDSFMTSKYEYAFQPTVLKGKDMYVKETGEIKGVLYDALKSNCLLWEQYRIIKNIARLNGVHIINLTEGGALDEFPRAKIDDLIENAFE